jgi:hypothetical protein
VLGARSVSDLAAILAVVPLDVIGAAPGALS